MLAVTVVDTLKQVLQAEGGGGETCAADIGIIIARRLLNPVRKSVHQLNLDFLVVIDAIAAKDEDVRCLADVFLLSRRNVLLVNFPDLTLSRYSPSSFV